MTTWIRERYAPRRTRLHTLVVLGVFVVLAAGAALVEPSSAVGTTWRHGDPVGDTKRFVDIRSVSLDTKLAGKYRFRFEAVDLRPDYGYGFRVYLDTRKTNAGPEFRVTVYTAKVPTYGGLRSVTRVDDFEADAIWSKHHCGLRLRVDWSRDVATMILPRRCVGDPASIRWGGWVMKVNRATATYVKGPMDNFPHRNTLFPGWVA